MSENRYFIIFGLFAIMLLLSSSEMAETDMTDPNTNQFSIAPYIDQNLAIIEPTDFLQNEDTLHYDGPNNGGAGWSSPSLYIPAVRFTPVEGCSVKAIVFFHDGNAPHAGYIYIYNTGTSTTPGAKLDSINYYVTQAGWFRYDLPTRFFANSGHRWWFCIPRLW